MVDPISNQQFSYDYQKFIFQDLSVIPLPPVGTPKTFNIPTIKKSKKDLDKEKSPFGIDKQKREDNKDSV